MSATDTKYSKTLITLTSVLIGLALKQLLKKGWQKTYQEDPPGEIADEHVNWGKMILWTTFSGLFLRMIKVGIKRFLTVKLEQDELLLDKIK